MGRDCKRAAGINETWCSEDLLVATSKTKEFYLPISSNFLAEIYMEELKRDPVIRLFPHGNVLASGTGTIVVNSMSFITNTVSLIEQDALVHRSLHKTRILSTHY